MTTILTGECVVAGGGFGAGFGIFGTAEFEFSKAGTGLSFGNTHVTSHMGMSS